MYLNKAIIYGNLTRDPELKSLPSGIQVATFSIATNRVWKNKEGARQENTDYHNIVVFGRQAETTSQYLKKGNSAMIEGRMQTRSWEGQDGKKNYRTEIVADRVQFGPKGSGGGASTPYSGKSSSVGSSDEQPSPKADNMDTIDYPEEEINPEDIPF